MQGHVTCGEDPAAFRPLHESVALGSAAFLERARGLAAGAGAERTGKAFLKHTIPFRKIVGVVETAKGEPWSAFATRYGDWGRDLAFYLARKRSGLTLAEIGDEAGGVDPRTVGQAVSRFGKRAVNDRVLRGIVRACLEDLSNVKM